MNPILWVDFSAFVKSKLFPSSKYTIFMNDKKKSWILKILIDECSFDSLNKLQAINFFEMCSQTLCTLFSEIDNVFIDSWATGMYENLWHRRPCHEW